MSSGKFVGTSLLVLLILSCNCFAEEIEVVLEDQESMIESEVYCDDEIENSWGENVDSSCVHDFSVVVEEPTCISEGKVYNQCTICGEKILIQELPKLEHNYIKIDEESLLPTCTVDGYDFYRCDYCGNTKTVMVPSIGHHHYVLNEDESVNPTCTEKGYWVYTCDNEGCGQSYKAFREATGHECKLDKKRLKHPTKNKDGYLTYICIHDGCDYSYKKILPALKEKH